MMEIMETAKGTEKLKLLLSEINRRTEEERCRFYVPNRKVADFINVVGEGGIFVGILSGGNGIGKTAAMVNILANIFWGVQNEWFERPLFRSFPYPKRARIGTESKNLDTIGSIDTEIRKWWPLRRYEGFKSGRTYLAEYKTDTDWVMDKMSYEQDTKEWESATLGLAVFDEPPPRDKFAATVSRLRQGGIILIFMTPLLSAGWIMDELIDVHDKNTAVVYAGIEDACIEHGKGGHLRHEFIQQMIEKMDRDEVQARAHGKFMHLSNVIMGSSFKREFHIAGNDLQPPAGCQWFHVVDPARGKPWAMGWGWVDLRGQIVFDREYPLEDWLKLKETNMKLRDYADVIRVLDDRNPIEWRIIDRHFANARNDYGTTLKQDLAEKFGLEFGNSYACEEEVETGIIKIKDLLGFNTKMPVDSLNFPRLLIKERCKNIIRSLERWPRDSVTLRPDPQSPYKDHADLVRYAAMANLEAVQSRSYAPKPTGYILGH